MKKLLKLLCIIAMLASIVFVMTGCDDDDDSSSSRRKNKNKTTNVNNSSVVEDVEEYNTTTSNSSYENSSSSTNKKNEKDVSVEFIGTTDRGDFVVKIKNNESKAVYINSIDVIFKDADNNFVEKKSCEGYYYAIPGKSELVDYVYAYSSDDFSKYPNYEFDVKYMSYEDDSYLLGKFEVHSSDTGKQVAVTVTNNGDDPADYVKVIVIFYKDGQITGVQTGSTSSVVGSGENGYINVSYPYDKNYKTVSYDKFETYLFRADKAE